MNDDNWTPLHPDSLVSAPCLIQQTLCQYREESGQPQLAKDFDYAKAILDAWRQQEEQSDTLWDTETKDVRYYDKNQTLLYGHVVRKASSLHTNQLPLPVILLFHTGAGPHDLFLLWKAAALVNTIPCIVFIADLLSDGTGWGWDPNRDRYTATCQELLRVETDTNTRPLLQQRIQAALDVVHNDKNTNIAALGWCLGGQPVIEMAKMNITNLKALVTFHGVFNRIPSPVNVKEQEVAASAVEVLICHATDDPFVPPEHLQTALEVLQQYRLKTSLLQLKGAKHGFTNPAQEFNTNPAFEYSQEAADKAWRQTLALLRRTLS